MYYNCAKNNEREDDWDSSFKEEKKKEEEEKPWIVKLADEKRKNVIE
jgi:hypothetical protein